MVENFLTYDFISIIPFYWNIYFENTIWATKFFH